MDNAKFWWSSNAIPPVPPVDVIGQSLRFRGNQTLTGPTVSSSTFTVSYWLKIGGPMSVTSGGDYYQWHAGTGSSDTGTMVYVNYNTNAATTGQFSLVAATNTPTSVGKFRDPSAWYHVVVNRDDTNTTMWVNGEQQIAPVAGNALSSEFFIGHGHGGAAANNFKGYMADWYFIDGQALEPTAFGRFNDNGVWVPREVDFTPAEMRFSDFVTTADGGGWFQDRTPERMFDGGTGSTNETMVDGSTDAIVFTPQPAIEYTRLEAWTNMSNGAGTWFVNDSAESGGGIATELSTWQELDGSAGTLTELRLRSGSQRANIAGIRITDANGTRILTNPFIYSSMMTTDGTTINNPTNMWTAGDGVGTDTAPNGSGLTIDFENPINVSNTVWVHVGASNMECRLNGGAWNPIAPSTPGTPLPFTGELNQIELRITTANKLQVRKIVIDGTQLVDGVNSSYGANGFHLDFSDPNDIGADRSGNGNDFTPNGFDTAPVGIFSNQQAGSPAGAYEPTPANRTTPLLANFAFDGDLGSQSQVTGNGSWYYWTPTLSNVTSLMFGYNSNSEPTEVRINGNVVTFTVGNNGPATAFGSNFWCIPTVPADGNITEVAFTSSTGTSPTGLAGFLLNGNTAADQVVDNTGTDYDVMQDSPTQNWATLNPLRPGNFQQFGNAQAGVISAANLEFTGTGGNAGLSSNVINTIATDQSFYFEAVCNAKGPNFNSFFAMEQDGTTANAPQPGGELQWGSNGNLSQRGGAGSATGTTWGAGDVIRIRWDAVNNIMGQAINDGAWTTFTAPNTYDNPLSIGLTAFAADNYDINFGQKPWVHGRPDGFEAVQTQNLPAATIANGRDHFQAITGPGTGGGAGQLVGNWTDMLHTSPNTSDTYDPSNLGKDFHSEPHLAFDGSTSTRAGAENDVWLVFRPDTPITVNTSLRVFTRNYKSNAVFRINTGATQPNPLGDGKTDWADLGFTGQLTELGIRDNPLDSTRTFMYAIEVDGEVLVNTGILPLAQQTFPNGLWWIKSRVTDGNTNEHQLVDSVRGGNLALNCPTVGAETAYVAPAGDSVAWCWNAGGAAVANNDGAIPTQVAANTDAGFSVITFTGTPAAGSLGHGLNKEVEFVIAKSRDANRVFQVYHKDLGVDKWLILSSSSGESTASNFWGDAANWNATTCGCNTGTTAHHNFSGDEMVWYAWTSVPGYSAFGSYTANGDDDGVFVYTGFSVAWLMCKRVGSSGDWVILDTTRGPVNPNNLWLQPNSTSEETAPAIGVVDLLSNGFKHRSASAQLNNSGDYIYCAFASNPFQAPVPAR